MHADFHGDRDSDNGEDGPGFCDYTSDHFAIDIIDAPSAAADGRVDVTVGSLLFSSLSADPLVNRDSVKDGDGLDYNGRAAVIWGVGISALKGSDYYQINN